MTQLARIAQIRSVLLCTLATLTLAACGGGADTSGTAATAAVSDATPVQSNVGVIDRSDGTSSAATVASTTAPNTAATTPATGSSTTAGTSSKATTPVQVVTTNGVATLDWTPPTSNSDGSVLTNLAGYTVYYGTSPNDLSQTIKVSNPGLASYAVTGLNSGTWYFAVTSNSSDGVESTRSGTISTTI